MGIRSVITYPTYKDAYMSVQDNNMTSLFAGYVTSAGKGETAALDALTDAQLLWLTAQGNRFAFECFYDRHERRIYNRALSRCQDVGLAVQLVQDVFVKLYLRVIDSEDPGKYQVGYLYAMLETAYIDHLRGCQHRADISLDAGEDVGSVLTKELACFHPDKQAEQDDIVRMIMKPLRRAETLVQKAKGNAEKKFALHRKKRLEEEVSVALETFNQLYRYGYSMQEMATNLGLTLEQVKYRDRKLLDMVRAGFDKTEASV